ncbi:hypothetical protein NVP1081O_216 [Vibrio phage 1.081.O._10N.286.52.C2]|nr:hypothetical protein NVP1081O_216 [Vibrio phage 1.081.O._10N.286.52.C2]
MNIRNRLATAVEDFPFIDDNPQELFIEALAEIERLRSDFVVPVDMTEVRELYVIEVSEGVYLHANPTYNFNRTGTYQTTKHLKDARTWQKPGMCDTFMRNNASYLSSDCQMRVIKTTYELKE